MSQASLKSSMAPVGSADASLLILGSLPGEKSLAAQRYYAHPTNQFWRLLGVAIGEDLASLEYMQRLERLAKVQAHVLDLAAPLVKPGGALVYAVCSVLAREGKEQVDAFLGRHSSWTVQDALDNMGRVDGAGRLLTPGHDGTDGFFVARLGRSC